MSDELFRSPVSVGESVTRWQGSVTLALARSGQNRPEAPGPAGSEYALPAMARNETPLQQGRCEETSGSCPLTSTCVHHGTRASALTYTIFKIVNSQAQWCALIASRGGLDEENASGILADGQECRM